MSMLRRCLCAIGVVAGIGGVTQGWSQTPNLYDPVFRRETQGFNPGTDASGRVIVRQKDNLGRPCTTLKGIIGSNGSNTRLKRHVLDATNICARTIDIKACYYNTRICVDFTLPSLGRKQVELGTMMDQVIFRYSFTEKAKY